MNSRNTILHAQNVRKTYQMGAERIQVLRAATLSVVKGEFVAIMGASGSGKSTLLHILGTLDIPDSGSVRLDSLDVFALSPRERDDLRCRRFGFIFQFYHLLPELNLFENILLPRMVESGIGAWMHKRAAAHKIVRETLEKVGLAHRLHHHPSELSGGERQRAAIARALINQPDILLADEPTGNLDVRTGQGILDVLTLLHQQGQTIVMVTHDARSASMADRCVTLEDGRIQAS